MRKRTRVPSTIVGLIIALVVMSLGPPVLAAPDAASEEAGAGRPGLLVPTWLQTLLHWLDRSLTLELQRSEPTQSTYAASQESGSATSPEAPGFDVTPQAGPNIDPDG